VLTPFPHTLYAFDLRRSGFPLKWTFRPEADGQAEGLACCDTLNAGPTNSGKDVLITTLDGHVVALDAETRSTHWDAVLADLASGETLTGASVSAPVTMSVSTPLFERKLARVDSAKAEYAGLSTIVAGGAKRAKLGTTSSSDARSWDRVVHSHFLKYRCHLPGRSSQLRGGMKRVRTVRGGLNSIIATMLGRTRSIQGVSQIPPRSKMFCMSTDRCAAF
jgi:hypothetical protein